MTPNIITAAYSAISNSIRRGYYEKATRGWLLLFSLKCVLNLIIYPWLMDEETIKCARMQSISHIDTLAQGCGDSNALGMKLPQSAVETSIWYAQRFYFLLCRCRYVIALNGLFVRFSYANFSRLLCWHWGNPWKHLVTIKYNKAGILYELFS